jgi:Tol biopolymer transport system component
MITGRYPFKGEHDASLFYSIINQNPEPLARYKADINESYQRIIDKALDKDSETRYQHIDEILSDIKRVGKDKNSIQKKSKKIFKRISFISAASLILILLYFTGNYFLKPSKTFKPPKHTQLTFDGNILFTENGPMYDLSEISPDGQFTAYITKNESKEIVYIKDNYGEQSLNIFKALGIADLRWSPSGRELFITAQIDSSSASSYIVQRFGGRARKLEVVERGCWSPDESLIAGIFSGQKIINLIKYETGEIIKTIKLKGSFTWLFDIDWSPDGKMLTFLTSDQEMKKFTLWIIRPDGIQQEKILEDYYIYSPRWSKDGKYIYYLQTNSALQDLMKLETASITTGRNIKTIQSGLNASGFSMTKDNKKFCYTKYNDFSNLWSFIYDEKTKQYLSNKLTSGTSYPSEPKISPYGDEILFLLNGNLFKKSVNGASTKQLTFLNSICRSPSWSPDGKEILFSNDSKLFKVSSEGGGQTNIENIIVSEDVYWQFNSEIFYHKSGNRNYYIYNPVTKQKRLLVPNDSVGWIFGPRLSPDSSQIAIHWNRLDNMRDKGIWIISNKNSTQKLLYRDYVYPLKWSTNGESIYAISTEKDPYDILKISKKTGKGEIIHTLPPGKLEPPFDADITADGKIIVCALREINSDVWMIENFDPDVE